MVELMAAIRSPEQVRYALWLAWGTRLGLGLLVVAFILYMSGLVTPHVPIERLPSLWGESAANLLRETGLRPGWGWAASVHRADMLNVAAIAWLASCSIPCLAAVVPVFRAQGERVFVVSCVLQIAVLALAASGVLAVGH